MDASCKIQRSIHDVRLTYKYVSRILGTYQVQQNYAAIFVITKIGLTVYRRHPISIIILAWFHTNVKKIPLLKPDK